MTTVTELAYAKVNLTLSVLGKRPDGYHDLKSVMQTISLCDEIRIDIGTGSPWSLCCDVASIPADSRNHAWKAAEVFFQALNLDPQGIGIRITKRIPSEAGLGGGSADAAAVLRALNRHYGAPFGLFTLADLGAKVGSDVPFCVLGGTAMAEGRGERLRRLPGIPDCFFVICKPDFSNSTASLYRRLDEVGCPGQVDQSVMEEALARGDLVSVARHLSNDFDPVVTRDHPEMDRIKALFAAGGSLGHQMSGSGSALFAITPDLSTAQAVSDQLTPFFRQVFVAKNV